MTSMRRNDVASTSFRRHVPTRFLINQCQIITFILKSDIIENSEIELRGIVLPVSSNQSYIYYYFTLQLGTFVIFLLFHIEIKGKGGWIIGGPKGIPPSQIIGGGGWPHPVPPPPPSSYAYERESTESLRHYSAESKMNLKNFRIQLKFNSSNPDCSFTQPD